MLRAAGLMVAPTYEWLDTHTTAGRLRTVRSVTRLLLVLPAVLRDVAQQGLRPVDRQERLPAGDCRAQWHPGEDFGHQVGARPDHHRIVGRHDAHLRSVH